MGELKQYKIRYLEPDLQEVEPAAVWIRKARRSRNWALVTTGCAIASWAASVYFLAGVDDSDDGTREAMGFIALSPFMPCLSASIVFWIMRGYRMGKAVQFFNKYPAFKARQLEIRKKLGSD